jgi:hypothetical protein
VAVQETLDRRAQHKHASAIRVLESKLQSAIAAAVARNEWLTGVVLSVRGGQGVLHCVESGEELSFALSQWRPLSAGDDDGDDGGVRSPGSRPEPNALAKFVVLQTGDDARSRQAACVTQLPADAFRVRIPLCRVVGGFAYGRVVRTLLRPSGGAAAGRAPRGGGDGDKPAMHGVVRVLFDALDADAVSEYRAAAERVASTTTTTTTAAAGAGAGGEESGKESSGGDGTTAVAAAAAHLDVEFDVSSLAFDRTQLRHGDTVRLQLEYSLLSKRLVASRVGLVQPVDDVRETNDVVTVRDGFAFVRSSRSDRPPAASGRPADLVFFFQELVGSVPSSLPADAAASVDLYDPDVAPIVHLGDSVSFDVEFDV